MPLQATSGAASYDGFGGGVVSEPNYIESCFSTYLYTGNGSTQTITNGIDLAGDGGLVWTKGRSAVRDHKLVDTVRGAGYALYSNTTDPQTNDAYGVTGFNSTGYNLDLDGDYNGSGVNYVSWTWAKAPKFFDVVTYTGNGAGPQVINHNLGSAPGCVIVKSTSNTSVWWVWHRGNGGTTDLTGIELNATSAASAPDAGVASDFTATTFNAGSLINVALNLNPNVNGQTYVAYLFAHNAGGFGLTGTDNVISCGSYTGTGNTSLNVNLGFEPQWVMIKNSTTNASSTGWYIQDNMRGMTASTGNNGVLYANLSSAEAQKGSHIVPTATGFTCSDSDADFNDSGTTYIYIAIRRGPMKVPTDATKVFEPALYTGNGSTSRTFTTSTVAPIDLSINLGRTGTGGVWTVDRLRGNGVIRTWATNAEVSSNTSLKFDVQNGYSNTGTAVNYDWNTNGLTNVQYFMKRAPSFFDEVCYTASASSASVNHNLGVRPEMVIYKTRGSADSWYVCVDQNGYGILNSTNAWGGTGNGNGLTNIAQATTTTINNLSGFFYSSGQTIVSYLFATCAGVSKVGSYTGSDSNLNIDCGFTSGARFVMIKRTDASSDWYVWDSARGIVSGNDPRLSLNTTAAEVTDMDMIDPYSAGFSVPAGGPNTGAGATFIFLAIA
jgi:hypothetical protein